MLVLDFYFADEEIYLLLSYFYFCDVVSAVMIVDFLNTLEYQNQNWFLASYMAAIS